MQKILTAVSGGVDSAVAVGLLREQGYEVGAATMLLRPGGEREAADAQAAARRLGVPFHLFEWQKEFQRDVIAPFAAVYQAGGTPNPCVFCNKALKFGLFLEEAMRLGYDGIATGHYARVERDAETGRYLLKTAVDEKKDQTYMLAGLNQDQLAHTVLPLGIYQKDEVRARAVDFNLLEQQVKKDSQDICFVPDGDYMAYLTAHGLIPAAGNFIDPAGNVIAPHRGFEGYTIGQRRGLEIPAGRRVYVLEKRGTDVVIGDEGALFSSRVQVSEVNWIPFDAPDGPLRATARLRYSAKPAPCTVYPNRTGAELVFDAPQRAVTPGQTAVFYQGERVLGSGVIESADCAPAGEF